MAKKKTASRGKSKTAGKKKSSGRKANAAFMAPVTPSDKLTPVVGSKPIPRTEVTKRLWAYIKKNKLQDQKNKRMFTVALPPKTGFSVASALIMRLFF